MKYDLTNRTVAITGAAGGLGRDLAKALRAKGASVALLDLNADAVRELADDLGDESVARGWQTDVRNLDNLTGVMDEVAAHFEDWMSSLPAQVPAVPSDRLRAWRPATGNARSTSTSTAYGAHSKPPFPTSPSSGATSWP